jgi:predicted DNA-binding transcriptional regulator AlpA
MAQPISPFHPQANLSLKQIAADLNVSEDAVEALIERGEGPPRFRATPRIWRYPAQDYAIWKARRLAEAEAQRPKPQQKHRKRRAAPDQHEAA